MALARLLAVVLIAGATLAAQRKDVLILAASSLQTALDELAGPAERATGARMKMSYAASSALACSIV